MATDNSTPADQAFIALPSVERETIYRLMRQLLDNSIITADAIGYLKARKRGLIPEQYISENLDGLMYDTISKSSQSLLDNLQTLRDVLDIEGVYEVGWEERDQVYTDHMERTGRMSID